MNEEKININIDSEEYSFVIKTGEVANLELVVPVLSSLASEYKKDKDGVYNLRIYDELDGFIKNSEKITYIHKLNPLSTKVKIIIPNNWIGNLNIRLEHGKLLLKDLVLDKTKIASVRGNIIIKDSYSGITIIDGIKSNLVLDRVNGDYASLATTTGNLKYDNSSIEEFFFESETGNINAIFFEDEQNNTTFHVKDRHITNDICALKKVKKNLYFKTTYGKFRSNIF